MQTKIRKGVIPAAGAGTRFLPATKVVPKELLPIVDKPTIQYIVEEAVASGIEQVILITARGKGAVEDHFGVSAELEEVLKRQKKGDLLRMVKELSQMVTMVAVRQEEPRGLGHAVLCAREAVGEEPFAVLLGDDLVDAEPPCLAQMVEVSRQKGGGVIALQRVPASETHLYGIIRGEQVSEGVYRITELVEKPAPDQAPSNLAIIGRYILPPEIFPILEKTPPGKGGEIQLTDALQTLARTMPLYGYEFAGDRYDAGDKFGSLQANIAFALKRPEMAERLKEFIKKVI
ncbi:MAG: UTP--glucose-1-phosphate uridylyltransferase [Deltaproteobacteria bacterium RBG_16_54_11]|jgi:UTP--glucose-1-phosphate uridylyltransferase|nr:MAG: UTP--glucose-1-phosphate uridylyltransferase [Deltaproteobacteria bacterium RBG_16_54_11]